MPEEIIDIAEASPLPIVEMAQPLYLALRGDA
jgi:hypothetical protein